MRIIFGLCLSLLWAVAAFAQERITNFDVDIQVETSGDIVITETLGVISEGQAIRRGIFRELPANYTFMGVKQTYDYDLLSVTRNGQNEPFSISFNGNAETWRIGQRDVFLDPGLHTYEIRYRVPDAVRRHNDKDEVYWNATGNYWQFPIERATSTITFPLGADVFETAAYTGGFRQSGSDYTGETTGNQVTFQATRTLRPGEGLTVAASIQKGVVDPLPDARLRELWWIRNGGAIILGVGGLLIFAYYFVAWSLIGRDPPKPPVFARYEPPTGYSAAATHAIYHRGLKDKDWLTAMLMQLSTDDFIDIEAEKKTTTITQVEFPRHSKDGAKLLEYLGLSTGRTVVMDGKTDSKLYKGVYKFGSHLMKQYGRDYYRSNLGWSFLGIGATIALLIFLFNADVARGPIVVGMIIALALMSALFLWLLPAPTGKGNTIRAEIEGFRLYLKTAEKDRINTANPLGDEPPLMSVELYERFLAYAVALGVEKPWTDYFETVLPKEAKEYRPSYARGSRITSGRNPIDFNRSLSKALTAGVAAAAPVSQSSSSGGFSSGSSGGGFSGGGGGGGGGGGW